VFFFRVVWLFLGVLFLLAVGFVRGVMGGGCLFYFRVSDGVVLVGGVGRLFGGGVGVLFEVFGLVGGGFGRFFWFGGVVVLLFFVLGFPGSGGGWGFFFWVGGGGGFYSAEENSLR